MDKPYKYRARLQLPSPRHAEIVAAAISVDPELRPDDVDRSVTADGAVFVIDVAARDPRMLRTAVGSLYDFVRVSLTALAQFA